ncbi:hypothetical protein OG562_14335 [Streptomyces sp. NBC_01275]|uniref:hypothetical protein n=1 Tax=Streptomyces sp. NBC_01275 TaxID=2903807 RepID=UPI00224DD57A|nr:hypothetical protein [Streptomyces sp. NBC_01275]MCX4762132.1 hypothetical protein [Streptomyces sp. NBC_01275]
MSDARTTPTAPAAARTVARVRHGRAVLPLLVCALYAVLQLAAGPQWTLFPDSYRYARAAEQYLGASREQAHRTALAAFCTSRAERTAHEERLRPTNRRSERSLQAAADRTCLKRWAKAKDITTSDPRYQAIFASRPGYPLLAAPFVGAFGVLDGMRLLGLLTAVGCSLLVWGLLRGAGLSPPAAVTGQIAFLATPLGWWSDQALGEGLFTACTLGALWGGLALLRRRSLPWAATATALAYTAGAVTRYSSALVLAAFTTAAAMGAWCFSRRLRHRGTAVLAGVSALVAASVAASMKLLSLPSSQVTLQDTFTHHFTAPNVSDPWGDLLGLAARFWRDWAAQQTALPYFLVLTALATWSLARYGEGLGWLALATALTGAFIVTDHPLTQEASRLAVLMWMPVVLGLPLAVERHWSWRGVGEVRTVG